MEEERLTKHFGDHISNQNPNDSCILIEENVSVIEINDSILEESSQMEDGELKADEVDGCSNELDGKNGELRLDDFQVIDQVDDSDVGSQEIEECDKVNQCIDSSANIPNEFFPPSDIDLNVTPNVIPEEPDNNKIIIDIKFHNRKTYLAFQEEFISLVKNYYKTKIDDMNIHDDMSNNRIRVSEKRVKKTDTFLVDKTPNFKNLKEPNDESTPTYRKSFGKTVLTGDKDSVNKERNNASSSKNACFNCDKDTHSLRDCPEPRNMKKVNKARNQFNRKELRYHDDNENEYGNLVPGMISKELRAALGLSETQIPLHVYRMRLFGYPPAWIEEAKIHNSGLSLFVEKDKKQLQPGADEGEMEENDFKYDVQKIFDFPGFNVEPDHPYLDQYRILNTPPMLLQHSKHELIQSLGDVVVNGYKKTKLRNSEIVNLDNSIENVAKNPCSVVIDMEIEDSSSDAILPPGVSDHVENQEPIEEGELSDDSCDENQLKEKRERLLAELAESSAISETSPISTTMNTIITPTNNHCHIDSTIIENSENENRDNCAKDSELSERTGHVETTIIGCPVLPSFSHFNSLPAGGNFQEGVCDVIAFENLAESTGKYEKMKTLIKKVRVFQQDHQKE